MLDQNTDRMWYVIGAVIVGAALIFLMNGTFPGLFGAIGETFDDKVTDAVVVVEDTTMTDGIRPPDRNLINVVKQTVSYNQRIHYKGSGDVVDNLGTNWYSTVGPIPVKAGSTYVFTAPKGLASPLVGFYSSTGQYLGYHLRSGEPMFDVEFVTPAGTAYVLVGAGDTRLYANRDVSDIDDWVVEFVK